MINHRIKTKPKTQCDHFQLIAISDETKPQNLNRISECSLFMSSGLHKNKQFKLVRAWSELEVKTRVMGFVVSDRGVYECLVGIDWNKYGNDVIGGGKVINKSDIIRAFEDNYVRG